MKLRMVAAFHWSSVCFRYSHRWVPPFCCLSPDSCWHVLYEVRARQVVSKRHGRVMVHTTAPQCGREIGKEEMLERARLLQQLFTGGRNRGASQGLQTLLMDTKLLI